MYVYIDTRNVDINIEYDYVAVHECSEGDLMLKTSCYRRLSPYTNWFHAAKDCQNIGYRLATYEDKLLATNASDYGDIYPVSMWLDVSRFPWAWATGETLSQVQKITICINENVIIYVWL